MKKIITKKLLLPSIVLFVLLSLYFFPTAKDNNLLDLNSKQNLIYTYTNYNQSIYLIDSKNYISKTTIAIDSTKDTLTKAKEMLEALIIDGKKQDIIPNGFSPIIPSDTQILDLSIENDTVKVNFSKEIQTVSKELEERMIEAIIYSLTSIESINNVIILVESNILTNLFHSEKILPPILNRDFGINKTYDITSINDINSTTVYYVNSYNNNTYYTPITKYTNNQNDKIKIIINELASSHLYDTNLMSFLNSNTKLVEYDISEQTMHLHFNNYLFDNMLEENILEEVMYTILLSVKDNYDIEEVGFYVDQEQVLLRNLLNIY